MSSSERRTTSSMPDFDELMTLALNDPDAFETERQRHIETFLENVPQEKRQRLTGLQWKVDQVRNLAKTPMAACIAISNMMRDSLSKLNNEQIKLLSVDVEPIVSHDEPEPVNATILPFTHH